MSVEAPSPAFLEPRTGTQLSRRSGVILGRHFSAQRRRSSSSPMVHNFSFGARPTSITAVLDSSSGAVTAEELCQPQVRIVAVVGHGTLSPLKSAPWEDVMLHTVRYFFKVQTFLFFVNFFFKFFKFSQFLEGKKNALLFSM